MSAIVHKTAGFEHERHDAGLNHAARKLDAAGEVIHLSRTEFAHLRRAAGWTVKALDGCLWITQDGDLRDIVLLAGQSITLDRNMPALISPMGEATFSLSQDSRHTKGDNAARIRLPALFSRLHPSYA